MKVGELVAGPLGAHLEPKSPAESREVLKRIAREGPGSEEVLQRDQIKFLKERGYLVNSARPALNRRGHFHTPIQGHTGHPDVTALRGGVIVIIENKSDTGSLRRDQRRWRAEYQQVPWVRYYLCRPKTWEGIKAELW